MTTVSPGTPLVRLGEMMHLNGTVPRGVDLRQAVPRTCQACASLFIVLAKVGGQPRFCPECQAKECSKCKGRGGQHRPGCSWSTPRPCRGCGVELGAESRHGRRYYCDRCRETVCPECQSFGGRHHVSCLWIHRARRVLKAHYQGLAPTTMPYQGVVSRQDIQALYETYRAPAIRYAHRLGANGDSEDVVHNVILWLIERQDFLARPPSKRYLFIMVRHAVVDRTRGLWRTVWADPQELVEVEAMQYRREHGRVPAMPRVD
jgi:hypothetical protein